MSRITYEILEHTADIGLRARGATQAELFENAAAGFCAISHETETVDPRETRELTAQGPDREALLVNWLDELLWLIDGERWLPKSVAVQEISETQVKGTAHGEPLDPARHRRHIIIKAVTYHQLAIQEENGEWIGEVYFDI